MRSDFTSTSVFKLIKKFAAPLVVAIVFVASGFLFQNCAEAPPPDLGKLNQSSVGPSNVQPTGSQIVVATPTPGSTISPAPPPLSQTYTWKADPFGICNGSTQSRSVSCVNGSGSIVADSNCGGSKPFTTQACVLAYTCKVVLSLSSNISYMSSSGGSPSLYPSSCTYTCTGPTTYTTSATTPTNCNPDPMNVIGTETGLTNNIKVNRPFTMCVVTKQITSIASQTLEGESLCN